MYIYNIRPKLHFREFHFEIKRRSRRDVVKIEKKEKRRKTIMATFKRYINTYEETLFHYQNNRGNDKATQII